MTPIPDAAVEAVARAIYEHGMATYAYNAPSWEKAGPKSRTAILGDARTAITAYTAWLRENGG